MTDAERLARLLEEIERDRTNLVFRVFLPEIERLQDMKAATVAAYRLVHPDTNPFEDRTLEVLSRAEIDVRDALLAANAPKGVNA